MKNDNSRIWDHRKELWRLTRPAKLPGIRIFLFHMIGVYLAMANTAITGAQEYWVFLASEPKLWLTFLSVVLVSATSMVINDYYDAKLGRDALKLKEHNQRKALVEGDVSLPMTKRLLTYLYAISLMVMSFLPGVATRLTVNSGLIMTYLYTVHLKPVPLLKNVACAALIAMAPLTSGFATISILGKGNVWLVRQLWSLFGAMFWGVLGREIMMDCKDMVIDRAAGVKTIPVLWGQAKAASVALLTTVILSALTCLPLGKECWNVVQSGNIRTNSAFRRFSFAILGSGMMLRRSWQVYKSEGKATGVLERAINESSLTVALLLASFI
eukprot:CAMPEP_0194212924 /NCGR_PEP_ID=MMETSP0156-20130528/13108_1 /TAXON_ID=33649 /ORGANISM="Thalassionema nitzschioides, Strain L26-B" /LENGTH=326 /DNA_ID=CAMNT_0038940831 /DNA_START=225 /DNA_END=1205 /DNA_ORIENTATION=+